MDRRARMMKGTFATIKKIDGSQMVINLDRIVSVELIPCSTGRYEPYYIITDTNNKSHLSNSNPFNLKTLQIGPTFNLIG